jgi:tripartite-type tricarboxylate transporter receptor subunit TctC
VKHVSLSGAFSAAALALGLAAPAANAADFKDKTITVVVPAGSGGTFHIYAQLVARHLGKHVPGTPAVITQNRPGAGGVTASNYMASAAPRDGTVIAEINPGSVVVPLLRKVAFDPRKFIWLGTAAVRTYTLGVWHTVEADTLESHKKTEVIMGSSGVGSLNYQIPTFMNAAMGTKYKVIAGYKGGGDINIAMERGEVQGRGNFYSGYTGAQPHWIRDKKIKFFATLGPTRPEVAHVPRLIDRIEGDVNRQMYKLLEVGFNIGQSFHLPEGVPKAQVEILRAAFAATLKDPEFLAEAEKRKVPIITQGYEKVESIIADAYDVKPEVPKKLAAILGLNKKKRK